MDATAIYQQASLKTADNLRSVAQSKWVRDLSSLSLPEIEATVNLVGQVVPAGNVPGVILSGLARLQGRKPAANIIKRDVNLLFKGVEQTLDKAVFGAVFAGPAAIIWGYQNLLKLAGKDPEDSFPEGTWQFYVDYALREDTARHAVETRGFDATLRQHQLTLSPVDRLTAWAMAAIHGLHQYPALLENEWRERVYTHLLAQLTANLPDAAQYAHLYRAWEKQRPYERGAEAQADEPYPLYRRRQFEQFLEQAGRLLPEALRREWAKQIRAAEAEDLPLYQQQLSIWAYLEPSAYGETRVPLPLSHLNLGLIWRGQYHLIPVCAPGSEAPAQVEAVRAQIAAIVAAKTAAPTSLAPLARLKRANLPQVWQKLPASVIAELARLRTAPILLNGDPRPRALSLAHLRQAERGIGDHALTLFDTGETFVFDQSHIFFDGAWGAALAEILTNEALAWAVYLHSLPPVRPQPARLNPLALSFTPAELKLIAQAPRVMPEAAAETETINVKAMQALRKLFKQRSDLLNLTINDLLILYRAIHAVTYEPSPELLARLQSLTQADSTRAAAQAALSTLQPDKLTSPPIVIPVDASQRAPRDRLYPLTFEVPLGDLDLLKLHRQTLAALEGYQRGEGDRAKLYSRFDQLQRAYLRVLADFGQMSNRAKEIALAGESTSQGAIKLLAHLPTAIQRMLDQVPSRFDVLNDLIRGREVFSNVGAVAPTSTLTRFMTAKDDNDKKTLAWGVITDAKGVMRLSLRDFRPHVALLMAAGQAELAGQMTQHYLDTYAAGMNGYIKDLRRIVESSRETQLVKLPRGQHE